MYKIKDLRNTKTKILKDVKNGEVIEVDGDIYIATRLFGEQMLYLLDIKTAELWKASKIYEGCDVTVKVMNAEISIID